MDVITPDHQDVYVNTMMDVQPIAVKKEGSLGEGSTFEMTGVYMLLTGTDEDGLQTAEANVSNGIYEDNDGGEDRERRIRMHLLFMLM